MEHQPDMWVVGISFVVMLFLAMLPAWLIAKQAGYAGASSLLLLIPVVGVIFVYVFAFSTWPSTRERAKPGRST